MKYKLGCLALAGVLAGCAASGSKVTTHTSPIDGKTTTTIHGSDFATSLIYPINNNAEHGGMLINGGSVVDKDIARIRVSAFSETGYTSAFFKADGKLFNLEPSTTSFKVDQYGAQAFTSLSIACSELQQVVNSNQIYMRVTFRNGYVDYKVEDGTKMGSDGLSMIKAISSHCL